MLIHKNQKVLSVAEREHFINAYQAIRAGFMGPWHGRNTGSFAFSDGMFRFFSTITICSLVSLCVLVAACGPADDHAYLSGGGTLATGEFFDTLFKLENDGVHNPPFEFINPDITANSYN